MTRILKMSYLLFSSCFIRLRESTIYVHPALSHYTQIPRKVKLEDNRQKYSHLLYLSLISPQAVQWAQVNLQSLAALCIPNTSGWDRIWQPVSNLPSQSTSDSFFQVKGPNMERARGMLSYVFPTKRTFAPKHLLSGPFQSAKYSQLSCLSSLFPKGKWF